MIFRPLTVAADSTVHTTRMGAAHMADMTTHTHRSRHAAPGFPMPRHSRKSGPVKPMPVHRGNQPRKPLRIPGRG
ncbi:hypothetical protein [Nocardia sp. NPDC050406]|uniref:hypothetical protein n=1 Tax=Nocardia sp. NPDC050406 TaxID=3364318 RepID=UPI0037B8AE3D